VTQARDRAREFIVQSQEALSALPNCQPRDILHALAEFTISRQI
jgi:hypothetical protein